MTTTDSRLPEGFRIERDEDSSAYWRRIEFSIYEDANAQSRWPDGSPRSLLSVTLSIDLKGPFVDRGPQISWPSTSDKRPVLAQALAIALAMAAEEASR